MICWEHVAVTGFAACHLPGLQYSFLEKCGRWGYPKGLQFPRTWGFSAFFQLDFPSRSSEKSGVDHISLFPYDWKARKLFECLPPSWGECLVAWLGIHVAVATPTLGITAPTPSCSSAKGDYRVLCHSFISLSLSGIAMASLAACHSYGAAFHCHHVMLGTRRSHDLAVAHFGICFSSLKTQEPGIFDSQKPFYLGLSLRNRSP